MGFEDALNEETREKALCNVEKVRRAMTKEDLAAFERALANQDRYPTEVIARAIKKDPELPTCGRVAIRKHRDLICSCVTS